MPKANIKFDLQSRYKRSKDAISKMLKPDLVTVMLVTEHQHYFEITGTSVKVWEMLDGKNSVEQIIAQLARNKKTQPQTLRNQVSHFLEDLLREHLIKKIK